MRSNIDFVLFDGEELVYQRNDKYFHGSEYFAKAYARKGGGEIVGEGILEAA